MRRRVRSVLRGQVRVEGPDPFGPAWAPERVAVLAHWSPTAQLSRSVDALVGALRAVDYDVVVVSACEEPGPLRWPGGRPERVLVLRKPNIGYDFGGWSVALELLPSITAAPWAILANDSLVGPFAPLDDVLAGFHGARADVWSLTDTTQFGHHLQSYFLGFRGGVLAEPALHRFWADVRIEPTKDDVIHRNEIGLSRLLRREGYVVQAAFPHSLVVGDGENPTIRGWRPLLERGFPFVKREILRDPSVAPGGSAVREVVARTYATEVREWL
jgi:lipopolysaccharide biosynthesis protein